MRNNNESRHADIKGKQTIKVRNISKYDKNCTSTNNNHHKACKNREDDNENNQAYQVLIKYIRQKKKKKKNSFVKPQHSGLKKQLNILE